MNRALKILFYILAGAVMLCLSLPNSTMSGDDYYYSYYCTPDNNILDATAHKQALEKVSEILPSQANHYMHENGRFAAHCLVQFFVVFAGYGWLTVAKTLLSLLVLAAMCRLTIKGRGDWFAWHSVVLFVYLLTVATYSTAAFFGNSALTFNYMLPTLGMLAVFIAIERFAVQNRSARWWQCALLFVGALFFGSLHEGFSLVASGVLLVTILMRRLRIGRGGWSVTLGYWAGTSTLLLSPASWRRLGENTLTTSEYIMHRLMGLASEYYVLLPVIVMSTVAAWCLAHKSMRTATWRILKQNAMYIAGIVFSFGLVMITGMFNYPRPFMPMGFLAAIVTLRLLAHMPVSAGVTKTAGIFSLCGAIALTAVFTCDGMQRSRARAKAIASYVEGENTIVFGDDTGYDRLPPLGFEVEGEIRPDAYTINVPWTFASVECYYTRCSRKLRFSPDFGGDVLSTANIVYAGDGYTVRTRPGAWWVVVEGDNLDTLQPMATEYAYKPLRFPQQMVKNLIAPGPQFLDSNIIEHEGREYLIIALRSDMEISAISLSDEVIVPLRRR